MCALKSVIELCDDNAVEKIAREREGNKEAKESVINAKIKQIDMLRKETQRDQRLAIA